MIAKNLANVKKRMAEAARKAGRDPDSVRLVTVTKTVPEDKMFEAGRAGATLFGESKIQEALQKIALIGYEGFEWHFIGHLQKNKVKFIFDAFELIHSVDNLSLAEEIHRGAIQRRRVMPVLIQVNVSGEESKFGVSPEGLEEMLGNLSKLDGLQVKGLMTIPPFDPDPERSRPYFAKLRELAQQMSEKKIDNVELNELSMGMSNDYTIAIEEGATLVRVGTAIFGERPPTGSPG